jgi:hypothetical protein
LRTVGGWAAAGEKLLHKGRAPIGLDASGDFEAVIKQIAIAKMKNGLDGSVSRIMRPKDETPDTGVNDGSSTHYAWLDRRIESGINQPVVADIGRRRSQSKYLGVGGRVIPGDRTIRRLCKEFTARSNEASSHRHFLPGISIKGLFNRDIHPLLIVFHHKPDSTPDPVSRLNYINS